ncbi:MAG: hypothetical protein ACKOBG_10160, partial [Actinomycetota bacterium]
GRRRAAEHQRQHDEDEDGNQGDEREFHAPRIPPGWDNLSRPDLHREHERLPDATERRVTCLLPHLLSPHRNRT